MTLPVFSLYIVDDRTVNERGAFSEMRTGRKTEVLGENHHNAILSTTNST
jgi:hypothetical protein